MSDVHAASPLAFLKVGICPFHQMTGDLVSAESTATVPASRIVVGDRIKQQMPDPRLISISDAESLLASVDEAQLPSLHMGQGIGHERMKRLYERLAERGIAAHPSQVPEHAGQDLTHKHRSDNVTITVPLAVGDGTYASELMVDDRCADMSDHVTGQHIPGMVVAEAARQMMIAVSEKYLLGAARQKDLRFVTHRMTVDYSEFVLPFPVGLRLIPLSLRRVGGSNLSASCEIRFMQADKQVACAAFSYSVVDKRYLESREASLVSRWIDDAMSHQSADTLA